MPRTNPDRRMNPWALVAIAVGLIATAFFFYTGHPVRDSNLYSPQVPGWISFVIFILIGALACIVRLRDRARDAKKGKSDVSPKT
jgi:putative Mn2+ efflux pump MntP